MNNKPQPERNNEIIELYLARTSINELAKRYNITKQRIWSIITKAGVKRERIFRKK
jgi:Mor family transcriptional regulator